MESMYSGMAEMNGSCTKEDLNDFLTAHADGLQKTAEADLFDVERLSAAVDALVAAGRADSAAKLVSEAVQRNVEYVENMPPPTSFEKEMSLADALLKQDKLSESLLYYTRARSLRPGDPEPFVGEGLARHGSGEYLLAIDAYERALSLDPEHKTALTSLAAALVEDFTASEEQMDAVVAPRLNCGNATDDHSSDAAMKTEAVGGGDLKKKEENNEAANLADKPTGNSGSASASEKKDENAQKTAVADSKEGKQLLRTRTGVDVVRKNTQRPLKILKDVLSRSPEDRRALSQLGQLHYHREEWDEALHVWRQVQKILPSSINALHNEVLCHLGSGELEEADRRMQNVMTTEQQQHGSVSPNAHCLSSKVHLRRKDLKGAIGALSACCAAAPDDVALHYEAAADFMEAGLEKEFIRTYSDFVRANPDSQAASQFKGLIQEKSEESRKKMLVRFTIVMAVVLYFLAKPLLTLIHGGNPMTTASLSPGGGAVGSTDVVYSSLSGSVDSSALLSSIGRVVVGEEEEASTLDGNDGLIRESEHERLLAAALESAVPVYPTPDDDDYAEEEGSAADPSADASAASVGSTQSVRDWTEEYLAQVLQLQPPGGAGGGGGGGEAAGDHGRREEL
eukprot:GHVU01060568.1.p1 GENE.GHVU01060568.1~~GHVU01060568.1.p1  ORF type:complete len:625 (+),score=168.21 GHVU01060568.1:2087-3961(+)